MNVLASQWNIGYRDRMSVKNLHKVSIRDEKSSYYCFFLYKHK